MISIFLFLENSTASVHDLVHSGFLVPTASYNILVVVRDVTAEHARGLLRDEDGGAIGRAPGVEQVVLAGGDKPFATIGKLEGKDTTFMQVKLVFVWL